MSKTILLCDEHHEWTEDDVAHGIPDMHHWRRVIVSDEIVVVDRAEGRFASSSEPLPVLTSGVAVWDLVIADMKARDQWGRNKYGTPLQVDNGRDHLVDAYQEALDLVVYLRAAIEKRKP